MGEKVAGAGEGLSGDAVGEPSATTSPAEPNRTDRLEPDIKCVRQIFDAWRKLDPRFRPTHPKDLMRILKDWYQWPYPEFTEPTKQFYDSLKAVDMAYDELSSAINKLRLLIPTSDSWHTLEYLLSSRISTESDEDVISNYLFRLERLLRKGPDAPVLMKRKGMSKGAPIKDDEVRTVVRLVCWYITNVEKAKVTRGFNDETGEPLSRAPVMIEATLQAMGMHYRRPTIETGIRDFKSQRTAGMKYWNLFPVLPPVHNPR